MAIRFPVNGFGLPLLDLFMFAFLRRSRNRKLIERLHARIIAAARNPVLFVDYGVADTLDGRFEMVTLHAALVLRHMHRLAPPAPDLAQDLADCLFRHFDLALREMGVGDTSVPKRMRALAEAYLGRSLAYEKALDTLAEAQETGEGGEKPSLLPLEEALIRNIYRKATDETAQDDPRADPARSAAIEKLAVYVRRNDESLAKMSFNDVIKGVLPFVAPQA